MVKSDALKAQAVKGNSTSLMNRELEAVTTLCHSHLLTAVQDFLGPWSLENMLNRKTDVPSQRMGEK